MKKLVHILQALIRERSKSVLVVFGLLAVLAGGAATRVRIDTSVDSLLMADDPDRVRNQALKEEFTNDEAILVAFELGHVFDADDLRKLARISSELAAVDGVEEVLDLSTIEDVRGAADTLDDAPLIDFSPLVDFSTLDDDIEAIRERVRGHRLYRHNFVSDELDILALIAILEPFSPAERAERIHGTTEAVLTSVKEAGPPWRVYFSGYPTAEFEANRILRRDFGFLSVGAFVLIAGIVYLAIRRRFALVLLSLLVAWSELVTLAWFGVSGIPLSPVSSAVPTIMVATSATYVIYALGLLARVSDRAAPAVAVIELLTRPLLLSALSTAIGFLSVRYINVQVIAEAGTALAVGISAAALGTLVLLPAVIHRFGLRLDPAEPERSYTWSQVGVRMAGRPHLVIALSVLVSVAAIPGILRVHFDTDILRQFRAGNWLRVSDDFIRNRLSGSFITNVIVRSDSAEGVLDPEVLGFTQSLIAFIEGSPVVDRTVSFLDYLYLMDRAMRPGEEPRVVPATRRAAAQSMLLYEMTGDRDDYRHYVNDDQSALNVLVRMSATSSQSEELRRQIESFARSRPEGIEVEVLGTTTLFHKAMMGITEGMYKGLGVALVLIVTVMTVMLGSIKLGLVALVPNVVPILVCGSLLGWSGISLSMGTSLVGCVALGLAVDDTAHVLGHLDDRRTLDEIYATVGRPLILTTIALGIGFSALLASEFESVAMLGAGTTLALIVALLCDLLLLPSLLTLVGYRRHGTLELDYEIDRLVAKGASPAGASARQPRLPSERKDDARLTGGGE